MEIAFGNKEVRAICENKEEAINKFGEEITQQIQARLSDIFAASSVEEIYVGNPRKIGDFPYMAYSINLTRGYKLEFIANDTKKFYLLNGELDWSKVSRVKIISIKYCNE